MRNSNFFAASCMLLLVSSCTSNDDIQEDSKFTVQSILNNQSITLPSIEKTLGTTTECTEFYSSENGYVSMSGNSFEVDGNLYYPLNIAADLMVRRWVKKENNGKTIYSPLWSYLCFHKGESNFTVVSYGPDARFLQNYELDEVVCQTKLPMHEKYSGTMFESDLDGTITSGAIYFNGRKTWKIESGNFVNGNNKCLVVKTVNNAYSISIGNSVLTRSYSGDNEYTPSSESCKYCGYVDCLCPECPTCHGNKNECDCDRGPCVICGCWPCDCGKDGPSCPTIDSANDDPGNVHNPAKNGVEGKPGTAFDSSVSIVLY